MPSRGQAARSRVAVSAPSWVNVGGMRMSMIATSGCVRGDGRLQRRPVGDGTGDLDAGLDQQPDQPLAQQHRIVGDHDAHGSSAITTVPRPPFGRTVSVPPATSARSAMPRSPLPAGSAPPMPSSSITSRNRPSCAAGR